MAEITSKQRQQSGAGGHGQPIFAQLTHGRTANDADESGTDTDDEGRLIQQAAATAKARGSEPPSSEPAPFSSGQTSAAAATPLAAATIAAAPPPPLPARIAPQPAPLPRGLSASGPKGKAPPKRPAGAITLRTLLDAGFVVPGSKVLYVEYKGLITWADLTEEGSIVCDGQSFESPSAFSIYVKRKLNPERKADDGWKAVKYAGKLLEYFKELYLRQQLPASGLGSGGVRGATPTGSFGGGVWAGPSPHSSTHPSPLRQGGREVVNGAEEDGPPSKRQRVDEEADGAPALSGGGTGRPSLKIKIKLKPAAPASARPGPMLPLPAPPVATVPCGSYVRAGAAGNGKAGAQPFRLLVSDMVVIVMDFHAHCSSAEVGGLLAGAYDAAAHTLSVKRAFPVLELQQASTSQATLGGTGVEAGRPPVAVEFDPTDFARVMAVIRSWGLTCVGSYRSHPAYSSAPNVLDVLYAARAQEAARTADGMEPSVCAIVAPYGSALVGAASSAITWFHVEYDRSQPVPMLPVSSGGIIPSVSPPHPAGFQPMALEVETAENPTSHMDIMSLVSTQFHHTARTYAARPTRAPMGLPWRPPSVASAALGTRPQQTCLDKLVASVVSRLPDMFEGDLRVTYGTMVRDMVQHEFAQAGRVGPARAAGSTEDGVWGPGVGGGASLATGRSRRTVRSNGAVAAAVRFHSDDEETEEEDDVQLDDEEEAAGDHEI
ncbi:hypothetical protein Vafri_16714 [Volvox africanus]|uniref:RAMA domain-containing protein n=1 Tax=Volvox africanus TaxID=51714 RepID=A0A8J4F9B8_9CHLO|nr:hypothetical protein Vafri_16714 [Volvox africanus]